MSLVRRYYRLRDLNFFVGIGSSVVLFVLFALSALRFVQRIFDIILLYIISPVSISTIPVDDGSRFKLWREMLITKVLSAYGIVLSMNLFFLIIPQINRIRFYDNNFGNGLVQLLFIIGGAFAVNKAYMVIAQLTGNNGGQNEAQQMIAGVSAGSRMAKSAVRLGVGSVAQVVGGSEMRHGMRNKRFGGGSIGKGGGGNNKVNSDFKGTKAGVLGVANSAVSKATNDMQDGKSDKNNLDSSLPKSSPQDNNGKSMDNESGVNSSNKFKNAVGTTGRIASLPVGVLKDVYTKGAVGTAKNIWPRIKNIAPKQENIGEQ